MLLQRNGVCRSTHCAMGPVVLPAMRLSPQIAAALSWGGGLENSDFPVFLFLFNESKSIPRPRQLVRNPPICRTPLRTDHFRP